MMWVNQGNNSWQFISSTTTLNRPNELSRLLNLVRDHGWSSYLPSIALNSPAIPSFSLSSHLVCTHHSFSSSFNPNVYLSTYLANCLPYLTPYIYILNLLYERLARLCSTRLVCLRFKWFYVDRVLRHAGVGDFFA